MLKLEQLSNKRRLARNKEQWNAILVEAAALGFTNSSEAMLCSNLIGIELRTRLCSFGILANHELDQCSATPLQAHFHMAFE